MTLQINTTGAGPDLVLLHGWGMTAAVWRGLAAELGKDFRIHAVDIRNFDHLPERLAAGMPARVTVCGWSLGGQIALSWAQQFPAQVNRLVLLATSPRFICDDDWHCGMTRVDFDEFAAEVARNPTRARLRFLALQATGDAAAHVVLRLLREAAALGGDVAPEVLTEGLQCLRENDLRIALEQIDQPALVMHGVNDAVIPMDAGACLARMLPNAEFALVSGAAHALFVAREKAVADRIRAFHD